MSPQISQFPDGLVVTSWTCPISPGSIHMFSQISQIPDGRVVTSWTRHKGPGSSPLDSRSILDFPNLNQDLKISKVFIKRFNNLITIYVEDK